MVRFGVCWMLLKEGRGLRCDVKLDRRVIDLGMVRVNALEWESIGGWTVAGRC